MAYGLLHIYRESEDFYQKGRRRGRVTGLGWKEGGWEGAFPAGEPSSAKAEGPEGRSWSSDCRGDVR